MTPTPSTLTAQLAEAHAALSRVRSRLPAATLKQIERRLIGWDETIRRQEHRAVAMPELVMRPGLPPRPLNKHYFTVVRTYE